jgi:hypothetical protein
LGLSAERLAPRLGAFRVASCELDNSLDLLDLLTHACMQLDLHRVEVEVNILPEANQERQGLFDAAWLCEVVRCRQLYVTS